MTNAATFGRHFLALLFSLPGALPAIAPWDKSPDQWTLADAYRVLQNSPWSPAGSKIEASWTQRHVDPQTDIVSNSPVNPENTNITRGIEISRSKPLPAVSVLWWSSKTVRLARKRLRQLRNSGGAGQILTAEDLPDYVLVTEGGEPLRILRDAREDLRDTVFLELADGLTLDLGGVRFVDGTPDEDARVEFHFPRQNEGRPTLDANSERIVFHCKASTKTVRPGRQNAISVRAEFQPRSMRVHGQPDL